MDRLGDLNEGLNWRLLLVENSFMFKIVLQEVLSQLVVSKAHTLSTEIQLSVEVEHVWNRKKKKLKSISNSEVDNLKARGLNQGLQ